MSPTEINTIVAAAVAGTKVEQLGDGTLRLVNTATPLTGTIAVANTSTALDFGFPLATTDSAATGNIGLIPAGTVVSNGATKIFVTMQDIVLTTGNAGPYSVKVRHALDDGTGLSATGSSVTTVATPIAVDAFSVINPIAINAALTEPQLDVQYEAAFQACLDMNSVAKKVNVAGSARQSNDVRRTGRQNALDASANGLQGRIFTMRPPLGTTPTVAMGSAEPGVGPYRNQRVVYTYPGFRTKISRIAQLGTAGGAGFTVDGVIDAGSDFFLLSVMSQLPPEEDPAQQTDFLGAALALESSPNAQGFDINTYIAFKAAGICAPIVDDGIAGFQSGVTSVDPLQFPALTDINRRRMADFIQDSLAVAMKPNVKKLNKVARRIAVRSAIRQFMKGLIDPNNQRIAGFTVDDKTGNTGDTLAAGLYRIIVAARTISSLKDIVLQTTIGTDVTVQELAPGEIQ